MAKVSSNVKTDMSAKPNVRLEAGDPGVWFVFTYLVRPIGCVEKTDDGWVPMERVIADGYLGFGGLYAKRKDAIDALLKRMGL